MPRRGSTSRRARSRGLRPARAVARARRVSAPNSETCFPSSEAPRSSALPGLVGLPGLPGLTGLTVLADAGADAPRRPAAARRVARVIRQNGRAADRRAADLSRRVLLTGSLPAGFAAGEHTLTFQGSISKGIVFTVPAAVDAGCVITGATLDWGFKASFRDYIQGGIARGAIEVQDGTVFADGTFSWANGTGVFDPETNAGLATFAGGIRFTGHEGVLDTTVSAPRVEVSADGSAYIVLDIVGTTQTGEPVSAQGVRFAELDSSAIERDSSGIRSAGAGATLTEEGAAAFGTYPAGEELDPVVFDLPLGECQVAPVAEADEEEEAPVAAETSAAGDTDEPASLSWLVWVGAAVLALLVIGGIVLIARRRRATS